MPDRNVGPRTSRSRAAALARAVPATAAFLTSMERIPDYTYLEAQDAVYGALGTILPDGRIEAFPLYILHSGDSERHGPADRAWRASNIYKVYKDDLGRRIHGRESTTRLNPHGKALPRAKIRQLWYPTLTVPLAAETDAAIAEHAELITRVSDIVEAPATIVGSRSLGLGEARSDIDVRFFGEVTFERFCNNKQIILESTSLRFRDEHVVAETVRRYQQFYEIPYTIAAAAWHRRFTKLRSSMLNVSFHFSYDHGSYSAEFDELSNHQVRTIEFDGVVLDHKYSAFMPRLYRVASGSRVLRVLTKMFLYSGVAESGESVMVRGCQVASDVVVVGRYGDYIIKR